MEKVKHAIRTDIAWSTPDTITVKGYDLVNELIGEIGLGDMAFLLLTGRRPTANESRIFNAIVVALVEHGITPSTLAARLTYAGAPEALQSAVAAGLCGVGSVFVGSMEAAAAMLHDAVEGKKKEDLSDDKLTDIASRIVDDFRERGAIFPGMGHPFHKPVDPRAPRLFTLAEETGFAGAHVGLMKRISDIASSTLGKPLPVNATGAIAAVSCELDLPLTVLRGIGVMARSVGLVGHILEETQEPMAINVWREVEEKATQHFREQAP